MQKEQVSVYKTLVKRNHRLGDNDYVLGRISGISDCLLGPALGPWARPRNGVGKIRAHICTRKDYEDFAEVIEEMYPGLCIFDYEMEFGFVIALGEF